jgi:UDP-N-acetylmuramoylalanine--D-glutamate ligase
MEDYVHAKGSIRRHQKENDICIYHPTNHYSRQIATSISIGKIQRYGIAEDGGVYERDGEFQQNGDVICSTNLLQLIGQHNIENACAAISVAKAHNLSIKAIENGLKNFKGLPHRLEYVRKFNGVDYYNDSFSSAPPAAVAAFKSFTQPEIVIIGGFDKANDFSILINTIKGMTNIKEVILIGDIRQKLSQEFARANTESKVTVLDANTMEEIVQYASKVSQPGDVVVLSPGTSSFDMFKDFYDRGDQFRNIVNKL